MPFVRMGPPPRSFRCDAHHCIMVWVFTHRIQGCGTNVRAPHAGSWAAVNKKDSYLRAQFYRIKARRGAKKAIMAVAASILTAIYHMLKDGTTYQDLGYNHFNRRSTDQQKTRLIKRLADLGYAVEIKPLAA